MGEPRACTALWVWCIAAPPYPVIPNGRTKKLAYSRILVNPIDTKKAQKALILVKKTC